LSIRHLYSAWCVPRWGSAPARDRRMRTRGSLAAERSSARAPRRVRRSRSSQRKQLGDPSTQVIFSPAARLFKALQDEHHRWESLQPLPRLL
jgi:hypothetical protein